MRPLKPETFRRRLESYFERYETTLQILRSLSKQQAAPQDFIILACARLDSLANLAVRGRTGQQEKFVNFLLRHSGHRDTLEQVSIPDLYASVLVEWWQLPGVIEQPGRLRAFDPLRQREFLEMYWKSEIALTEDDIGALMEFLADETRQHYRVIPHQSKIKLQCATVRDVHAVLTASASSRRKGLYAKGVAAFKPIIQAHRLAAVLYREYRNESIHGGGADIDEDEFFKATHVRWTIVDYEFASATPIFQVLLPAKFLLSIYENCFRGYHKQLLATKKLPSPIYNELFPGSFTRNLSYLDNSSVEDAVELRPKFDR